jgi:hypothetical protein
MNFFKLYFSGQHTVWI